MQNAGGDNVAVGFMEPPSVIFPVPDGHTMFKAKFVLVPKSLGVRPLPPQCLQISASLTKEQVGFLAFLPCKRILMPNVPPVQVTRNQTKSILHHF